MRTSMFFPAISTNFTSKIEKSFEELFKLSDGALRKSIRFYNKDSYFYHPYTLFSAAHHYKVKDLRAKKQIDDDVFVFGDSGGYQVATGKAPKGYNDKTALEWCEKNTDIFPILDTPIGTPNLTDQMERSVASAKFYVENRSATGKIILNVVSGCKEDGWDEWYDAIKEYELDGWAMGGHFLNPRNIIVSLLKFMIAGEFSKEKLTYCHVFGVSNSILTLYICYFQFLLEKYGYNCQLTYDSSTFSIVSSKAEFISPQHVNGFSQSRLAYPKAGGHKKYVFTNEQMPCDCVVCETVGLTETINNNTAFHLISNLHGLKMVLRSKQYCDSLIYSDSDEMLAYAFPSNVYNNLMLVKNML